MGSELPLHLQSTPDIPESARTSLGRAESASLSDGITRRRGSNRRAIAFVFSAFMVGSTSVVSGCGGVDDSCIFADRKGEDCPRPSIWDGGIGGNASEDGGDIPDAPTDIPSTISAASPEVLLRDEIVERFTPINAQFPVTGKSTEDIVATFGLRTLAGKYDFHRGIDIKTPCGTPVVAAMEGKLWRITNTETGGNSIYIQHKFSTPVYYNGRKLTEYYTKYSHLESINPLLVEADNNGQNPDIPQGGSVGNSGDTGANFCHLHFELLVGTWCSLEAQKENGCSVGFDFDPHMHPHLLFGPVVPDMNLSIVPSDDGVEGITIQFRAPNEQAILNRVEHFVHPNDEQPVHILDFMRRIGFDASSVASLDNPDESKPYMSPVTFEPETGIYTTNIVIPYEFSDIYKGTTTSGVTVKDIWGNQKTIELP